MTKPPKIRVHGRMVLEWIGKTLDTMPPPSIRARIFDRCEGACHITKRKIQPGDEWHLDHIKPIRNGGENREGNLAVAYGPAHRVKTAKENSDGAKADRAHIKHIGAQDPPDNPIPARPFKKPEKPAKPSSPLSHLGPSNLARRFV